MPRIVQRRKESNPLEETWREELGISRAIARLLFNRGIETTEEARRFLNPSFEDLHDPFLMNDMDLAVDAILLAVHEKKKIRIVGDYDQDGTASTVILMRGLASIGANVDYVIPHRIRDGYGINEEIVKSAKNDGIDLIITCDNGIAQFEAAELAESLGIQYIVTDHHQVKTDGDTMLLPHALACINPARHDSTYPFPYLCGATVAYKLVEALYRRLELPLDMVRPLLAFAAMGTVCDVMPLVDENRTIVIEGLEILNEGKEPGIRALINESGWNKDLDVFALSFIIGPMINAAGRIAEPSLAVNIFLEEDPDVILSIAKELVEVNEERKRLTREGYQEAIQGMPEEVPSVIVSLVPDMHESIAGIVAGRIKEKYHRPTIVLTRTEDGLLKGSGRSVEGYSMFESLSEVSDYLERFGGHPLAAGLSLKEENFEHFVEELNDRCVMTESALTETILVDFLLRTQYLTLDFFDTLKVLEPYGEGNPEPVFFSEPLNIRSMRIIGKNKNVLKFRFQSGEQTISGIAFHGIEKLLSMMEEKFGAPAQELDFRELGPVRVVYSILKNEYMGNVSLELKILAIQ